MRFFIIKLLMIFISLVFLTQSAIDGFDEGFIDIREVVVYSMDELYQVTLNTGEVVSVSEKGVLV